MRKILLVLPVLTIMLLFTGCGFLDFRITDDAENQGKTPVIKSYTELTEEGAPDSASIELDAGASGDYSWELTDYDKTHLFLQNSDCVSGLYKFCFLGVQEGETDLSFTKHYSSEDGVKRAEVAVYSLSIDSDLNVTITDNYTKNFN